MKHLIARTLTSLMLVAVGLAVTAPAQSVAIKVIKVNIPFEFNFGEKTLPAGNYSLAQTMQHFLVLRNSRGRAVAQAFTVGIDSPTPAGATNVMFYSSGGRHILTEVWRQQDSSGERLYQAKQRTNLANLRSTAAREIAKGNQR
jgi:hypothetical protein